MTRTSSLRPFLRRQRPRLTLALVATLAVQTGLLSAAPSGAPPAKADSAVTAPAAQEAAGATADSEQTAARAQELKARGDELFRARDYVDALEAYEQSYALSPDARVLYNQSRTLEALGRYAAAYGALTEFAKSASPELRDKVTGLNDLLRSLRSRLCELTLSTNVDAPEVRLAEKLVPVEALGQALLIQAGPTKLVVRKDGYFDEARLLTLPAGGVANVTIDLRSRATSAKLTIQSPVPGAQILVDGKQVGNAPSEIVLQPGTHRVLARRAGYDDDSTQLILVAGQDRRVTLTPQEQEPSLYQTWWFWGGVGAVVVGGVVLTYLATQPESPSDGDFSPDIVSAPLVSF